MRAEAARESWTLLWRWQRRAEELGRVAHLGRHARDDAETRERAADQPLGNLMYRRQLLHGDCRSADGEQRDAPDANYPAACKRPAKVAEPHSWHTCVSEDV